MRMEDIQGMRIGGRDVTEVKLGGKVVWPMNVETYEAVAVSQYYYLNGNPSMANYIPANGSGYVIYAIRLMYYLNGVRDSSKDVILRAQSVNFTSSGAQGQTWTRTYSGGDILVGVNSREKNEDTSNTSITLSITASYNGVTYTKDGLRAYQQMNQKTILSSTPTITAVHPSVTNNTTYTSSSPCPASGSGSGYAQIGCKVSITDVKQVSFTSGATDTESVPRATQTTLANSEYTCTVTSGRGTISGNYFTFPTMGTTPYSNKVSSVVRVSVTANNTTFTASPLTFWQEANTATITYHSPQISISANDFTSSSSPCGAGGGSTFINIVATRTKKTTYTSLESIEVSEGIDPTITSTGSGLSYNASSGLATWEDRTDVTGSARSGIIRASFSGATSKSVTLYQQKNEETGSTTTYSLSSAISITASGTPTRASGGSSSSNYWTIGSNSVIRSVKKTYTSNYNAPATTTNMGAPTYSTSSSGLNVSGTKVWWDNMGATPYNYGRSGSFVAKYNGSQVGDAKSVEQSSNTVESYSYEVFLTIDSNTSNFTISNAEHQLTYDAYQLKTPTYTSGAQGSVVRESRTPTSSNSGVFIVQGGLIRVGANTYTSTRYSIITVRSTDNSASKSITITQEAKTYVLRFSPTSYYVPYNATQLAVGIVADINWTLNVNNAIVSGNTSGSGSRDAVLEVNRNLGGQRSATIQVQGTGSQSNLSAIAQVTQGAYEGQWIGAVDKKSHTVTFGAGSEGLTMIVPMHTNGIARKTSETGNTGWYTLLMNIPTSGEDYRITITCNEPASTGFDREATIVWTANNEQLTLYIRQTPN